MEGREIKRYLEMKEHFERAGMHVPMIKWDEKKKIVTYTRTNVIEILGEHVKPIYM